jgi:hypothetical protein
MVLEAFDLVCRGMDDPISMQISLDFDQNCRISVPDSDPFGLSKRSQSVALAPEPAGGQGVHNATNWKAKAWSWTMGRGLLLWLIGIPLPIILVIWLFGGLS